MSRSSSGRSAEAAPAEAPLITNAAGVAEIAESLRGQPIIAFDTEFLREKTFFPQLGLLQIADRKQVWLIDPLEVTPADMQPLLEVFSDPNTLKVAHSAEQDQECLFQDYGVLASPLLDTSIAAALTGRGDQIGLAPLLRKMLDVHLPKSHTRANWLARPLKRAMLDYAAEDVVHLVELAEMLLRDLERRGRKDWALKLSAQMADRSRYEPDGSAIAAKLAASGRLDSREYEILKRLTQWREERIRKSNIPRRWLAEDQALVQIARSRPRKAEDLEAFNGAGLRIKSGGAAAILRAVEQGLETPAAELEEPPRKLEPSPREAAALTVLKCFLNFLAQENEIPLRYLVDNDTSLLLLRDRFNTVEELEASKLLSPGALEVFGEELLALLNGRRALKIQDGRPHRFDPGEPASSGKAVGSASRGGRHRRFSK
ncbi:MAG: hypothetical protein GC160_13010 [Acidobacteria bacterium]|nr:hypothetical protein [Acidobacteriota bacterium]